MSISAVSDPNTTSRGTKIVRPGNSMDKDAFLRILTAELSNQDPTAAKDSTEYVAQMAQFTSLEQMSNLNTTMTMSSANSMIGKNVLLNSTDQNGVQYNGTVRAVARQGSDVKVGVEVNDNGQLDIKEFSYSDISGVFDNPNGETEAMNNNMLLLTQASMIGKRAEFDSKDANGNNYSGVISGIVKNGGNYDLSISVDGTNEVKVISADKIIKLFSVDAK